MGGMASTDDLTQPVTESFLDLSQDVDEISDSSVGVNTFDNSQLMHLVKQIDNDEGNDESLVKTNALQRDEEDMINDDTELYVDDEMLKPMISSQSTPLIKKNKNYSISINELNGLLKPLLNKEFTGLKQLLLQVMKSEQDFQTPIRKNHSLSDIENTDSEIDISKIEDSPTTTPPNSQEEIKDTTFENYTTRNSRTPREISEVDALKQQVKQLQLENNRLRGENNRYKDDGRIRQLEAVNKQLTFKLNDSKSYNKELLNEIDYLNKSRPLKQPASTSTREQEESIETIRQLNEQIGDASTLMTGETVDSNFRNDYNRLQLYKIDKLSKVEMSNLIKKILLTLVLKFDELPENLSNFIKFFKQLHQFTIKVHNLLYRDNHSQISLYYKTMNQESLVNLSVCLHDMCDLIEHSIEP